MSEATRDLTELIRQAKEGDDRALNAVLDQYRPFLRLTADQALGPVMRRREDASDIVQATQLDVFRDIQGFRGGSEREFSAWIRQILRRNIANMVRDNRAAKRDVRRETQPKHDDESATVSWFQPAAQEASPSLCVMKGEAALRLAAALEQLPDDQRTAVRLRHLESCSLKEICATMDRTPGAVAGLIRRGLVTLRKHIDDDTSWL